MILKALYDYYQAMAEQGNSEIAPFGMDWEKISCILVINKDGKFIRMETSEKNYLVPSRKTRTSGVVPYILWDKASYVLGVSEDDTAKKKERARQENEAFKDEVNKLYERFPENEGFRAVHLFYKKEEHLKVLASTSEQEIKSVWISFRLMHVADPNQLVPSDDEARQYRSSDMSNSVSVDSCCIVTGKKGRLAKTHTGIAISKDTPPLISFQTDSGYDSYGKKQGANAPVSEEASDAIRKGLNMLLKKDKDTNYTIGDTKFVFWSTLQEDELLASYKMLTFSGLPSEDDFEDDEDDDLPSRSKQNPERSASKLKEALKVARGHLSYIDRRHPERFFILGLTPNKSRLSVKLWMEGTIREIVGNTLQHLDDMNIVTPRGLVDPETPPLRPVYRVMKSIYRATDSSKWPKQIVQELIESIVKGLPYPPALQMACLERIQHDHEHKYPVTELRAALLKATINRKHRNNPHITQLTMALDKTNATPAYLAGRLFALLERIQEVAIPGVKANITDRYFRMASSTPGAVFGRLLQLSGYHLSKIKKEKGGLGHYFDNQIQEVLNLLPGGKPSFSKFFTPDEQSIFAVGYYHQRAYRDKKAEDSAQQQPEEN